jgi:hypothetical protein
VVDPQLLRSTDVGALLRLMAQLVRLSAAPSLRRSKLVDGLASILNIYVVGIFVLQDSSTSRANSGTPLTPVEVCWSKPSGVIPPAPFPPRLLHHCEQRGIRLGDGFQKEGSAQLWTSGELLPPSGQSNDPNSLIELAFNDAIPPPLAIKSIHYLLYGEHMAASSLRPVNIVTL